MVKVCSCLNSDTGQQICSWHPIDSVPLVRSPAPSLLCLDACASLQQMSTFQHVVRPQVLIMPFHLLKGEGFWLFGLDDAVRLQDFASSFGKVHLRCITRSGEAVSLRNVNVITVLDSSKGGQTSLSRSMPPPPATAVSTSFRYTGYQALDMDPRSSVLAFSHIQGSADPLGLVKESGCVDTLRPFRAPTPGHKYPAGKR
jgi:hypothetical protein